MKIVIRILAIIIFFISCSNPTKKEAIESESVTGQDIYMFIKMVLNDSKALEILEGTQDWYILDELKIPHYFDSTNHSTFKLSNYFTNEDLKFIKKQIDERKEMKLVQDSIYPKQLLSSEIIDSLTNIVNREGSDRLNNFIKKYTQKFGNQSYEMFSLPVFSKDKKTVYIERSELNSGRAIIYKKENGKWKEFSGIIWI